MNTTAKELALGGMFTALGVVLLCLGGVVPLALYACPILASAVLLPVRERCRKQVAWSCYAAIAILGTLLGPDKEASMLFVFLGYYPLVKPKLLHVDGVIDALVDLRSLFLHDRAQMDREAQIDQENAEAHADHE